ncbi:MAG: hypothetical protein AB4040_06670 [Synechococcus sp.]
MNDIDLSHPELLAFQEWVMQEIQQLSVSTLRSEAITCTACGETQGTYIIEYRGQTFRLPAADAYAFLKFVDETA